jgi:Zn-dependent protease/predicted transcriptional regulator
VLGDSISLGRVAGIQIGVNWSWVIVFALITWTLAAGIFPETNPGLSDGAYIALALVASALFFVSLLLHELGHAVQARRDGVEIEGITLWLFGGVAKFKGQFPSAGAEFRIAIAGPLVSLVLGVLFVLVAALAGMAEEIDAVTAWLGYTNLTLLAFNLLPALPLDGGRVLRSLLWWRKGDFAAATRTAATVGRAIAYGLIGLGVAMFILQGAFSGAWLAFIGWFLLQAATQEARWVAARQALSGLRVRDLMVRSPVTVPPDLPLARLMDEVVQQARYTTYPVVDDGKVVGLLPFRCVAEVPRSEWESRTVRDCMLPLERVPKLSEDEELADAVAELSEDPVHRGLVLSNGSLAGLLSLTDAARALEIRSQAATPR